MYKIKYFDGDILKEVDGIWSDDYIMLIEDGQKTFIIFENEGLKIMKKGIINFEFFHKINEEKENNYEIFLNNQKFLGKSLIKTIDIKKTDNFVELTFLRDQDLVINKWEKI